MFQISDRRGIEFEFNGNGNHSQQERGESAEPFAESESQSAGV